MTRVSMKCGWCTWSDQLIADPIRADQEAYMAIWQHVMAAHNAQSRELRTMSIRERKEALLSWTTTSAALATPSS